MKAAIGWEDLEGGRRVRISQPGPGAVRLAGLPFLAIGGYFFYQLIDGMFHPGELTIAGWIALPLMGAIFFVPGWLITAFRKRAVLDGDSRRVIEEFDFLLYTRRTSTPIGPDAHAMLRYERGSQRSVKGAFVTHTSTSYWIHVYLVTGGRQVLLALFADGEKAAALAFAGRVAGLLKIDVRDRLVEGGEVTSGGVVVEEIDEDDAD